MNQAVEYKIDKIIEEANLAVQDSISKIRGGDILGATPIVGGYAQMHQGYKVGDELGHPVVGTLVGAEGAAGARSMNDDSVSVGDVYTAKNMAKRGLQLGIIGTAAGAMQGLDDPETLAAIAAGTTAAGAGLVPGFRYGIGKVAGQRKPKEDIKPNPTMFDPRPEPYSKEAQEAIKKVVPKLN